MTGADTPVLFFEPRAVVPEGRLDTVALLRPGLTNITTVVIVVERTPAKASGTLLVGDPSGLITLAAPEEALALTREGDILRITSATTAVHPVTQELLLQAGVLHRVGDFELNFALDGLCWRDWRWVQIPTPDGQSDWRREPRGKREP